MKKSVFGRKLGRNTNQRKALFRSLIAALVEQGQIKTTLAKAKAVKAEAEKLITKAKKGTLTDKRVIFRTLPKRSLVNRLVEQIAPQLKERKSGYLRILKLEERKGDRAKMALLSFVDEVSLENPATQEPPKKEEKASPEAVTQTSEKKSATRRRENDQTNKEK